MRTADPADSRLLDDPSLEMLWLDVFDTALIRVTGHPSTLFLLCGRRLARAGAIACSPERFAWSRTAAERRCRQNLTAEDVTLDDIYSELGRILGLCDAQRRRVMEEELELERRLLRPVPDTLALVGQARRRGLPVGFVSDTYLPYEFVRDRLRDHGLYQEGDGLHTSSQDGHTKQRGSLFRDALRVAAVPAAHVLHRGNDRDGDLNRYERLLERFASNSQGLSSVCAGASRMTRLTVHARSDRERVLRDVAAGVAAPTLVGYVLWILQQAQKRNLRRLYFNSREGEILLAIARQLAPQLEIDCDLVYLYGSRQAWHLASVVTIDDSIQDWLFLSHDGLSIARVLRRVCLTPEKVRPALERLGFSQDQWSQPLSPEERERLRTILKDEEFRAVLLASAAAKRSSALRYFHQADLVDEVAWALVDTGWAGMIQRSLARLLSAAGRRDPPLGFYFGLASGGTSPESGVFDAYMFDHRTRTGFGNCSKVPCWPLVDVFCEGTEGQLLEDRTGTNGRAEPVLREHRNEIAISWGLPVVHETILQFARIFASDLSLTDASADLRPATAKVLQAFWYRPSIEEARVWGEFPYEVEQGGGPTHELGRPYTWKDAAWMARQRRPRRLHAGHWLAASDSAAPTSVRLTMAVLKAVRKRTRTAVRVLHATIVGLRAFWGELLAAGVLVTCGTWPARIGSAIPR